MDYRLSANGSVLVETWTWPDRAIEGLTLYHMDVDRLTATHYCPIGNQPRLYFDPLGKAPGYTFEIESVTNLSDPATGHNTAITIELLGERSFARSETYVAAGVPDTERSTYRRR